MNEPGAVEPNQSAFAAYPNIAVSRLSYCMWRTWKDAILQSPYGMSVLRDLLIGIQCKCWSYEEEQKGNMNWPTSRGASAVYPRRLLSASASKQVCRESHPSAEFQHLFQHGYRKHLQLSGDTATAPPWERKSTRCRDCNLAFGRFTIAISVPIEEPGGGSMAYALEGFAVANALESEAAIGRMNSETERKQFKEKEIRPWRTFGAIVGRSRLLEGVLQLASVVAPTDSSVLIQGETGTGKELVARAIHYWSARRDCAFIKLNCAAIPFGLLESDLFGHEKGAFTGAIAQKVGRFELANKGTLFLDEVGDIPLELQAKLLRVLQEQEFERLGSNRTHKVDVRLIAATHRDLCAMIRQSTFREDLYYRMRVFPIHVPPLRQRAEDIPELARHFTAACAQRMNKRIDHIPAETLDAMARYPWPGNIRELQNFIERAVILSPCSVLCAPIDELEHFNARPETGLVLSRLAEVERQHILRALQASNWVVGGRRGAAECLGMKRTSLIYRMRKLGIGRQQAQPEERVAKSGG